MSRCGVLCDSRNASAEVILGFFSSSLPKTSSRLVGVFRVFVDSLRISVCRLSPKSKLIHQLRW